MQNITLPIAAYRADILTAVRENPVVIVTAETGAGKSTQVPQYLLEEGYELVVTQPRRLAARTVAERVASKLGDEIGGLVGYRTAVDRKDSADTRVLFCTDGLALVQELVGNKIETQVLVIDEVHEWNENIEVLVAWVKAQIREGSKIKVVLMSATLEDERLSRYFDNAPVIKVPGRVFPVEERRAGESILDDIRKLVQEGRNVLAFMPGKAEIEDLCIALGQLGLHAEVLPLHGQLSKEEQARCFQRYGRPKVVVSTNVAQTSVTIEDIDAVVDSGLERRIELVDGVEGLYLLPISWADSDQRKGRAGRTKPGIYLDHCPAIPERRADFSVAEILRRRLDQTVLRLAIAGFRMEELEFFHQPMPEEIQQARQSLVNLGCMTSNGQVTQIGKLVNRLPVSVQFARMLVEARRLGVVEEILTIVAIMEVGGITMPPPSRNRPDRPDWRQAFPGRQQSDPLAQLALWEMAKKMSRAEMSEKGISPKDYPRAQEIRSRLAKTFRSEREASEPEGDRREAILKAIYSGMVDNLYHSNYRGYQQGDEERELSKSSLVDPITKWVVGVPFDLEIKTRRGGRVLHLLEMVSQVKIEWMMEIAPHLIKKVGGLNPYYDPDIGCVVSTTQTYFNRQLVKGEIQETPNHPEASQIVASWSRARESLHWNNWQGPEIPIPDYTDPEAVVPLVREVYGHSLTGAPLFAYGTLEPRVGGGFFVLWVRSSLEAQRKAHESGLYLSREIEREQSRKANERKYRQLKVQVEEISNSTLISVWSDGVRETLSYLNEQSVDPRTDWEIEQWVSRSEQLLVQIEQEEEQALELQQAIDRGEGELNFSISSDSGEMTWVIDSDGIEIPGKDTLDTVTWRVISPGQLVLRASMEGSQWTYWIHRMPTDGVTEQQRATVRRVEDQLREPFAFGLQSEGEELDDQQFQYALELLKVRFS
ncbi:ATP-dependent RNA helicase [Candidatus Saccharibacteria bacterium]|nr:ATP-dependent RNA helicase [Candidatus Saccharibacteria bacterium]